LTENVKNVAENDLYRFDPSTSTSTAIACFLSYPYRDPFPYHGLCPSHRACFQIDHLSSCHCVLSTEIANAGSPSCDASDCDYGFVPFYLINQ